MEDSNKAILQAANAAVDVGEYEHFLDLCTEDTNWQFVGEFELHGKEAVRKWMAETYLQPPINNVHYYIAEDDFVTAVGHITVKDKDGSEVKSHYCDVWKFRDGKMAELKAFVIKDTGLI